MDEPPPPHAVEAPAPPPRRRRPSPAVTLLLALAGAWLLALLYVVQAFVPSADALERPAETAVRAFESDLDLRDALARSPWLLATYEAIAGAREEALRDAIGAYGEVLELEELPLAASGELGARRLVLELELGGGAPGSSDLEPAGAEPAAAVAWSYGSDVAALDAGAARERLDELSPGWAKRRALRRWAQRAGDGATLAALEREESARLAHAGRLGSALQVVWLAVLVCGGAAAAFALRGRRAALGIPEWPMLDGLGVAVRGLWIYVVLALVALAAPASGAIAALAAIGYVAWATRRQLHPRAGAWRALGLRAPAMRAGRALAFTLAICAADQAGSLGLQLAAEAWGWESPWSEGVLEPLLYEPWPSALALAADVGLVAPLFEEILFRGLIYGTLRIRLPAPAAIPLSALSFAVLHAYSPVALVAVAWSGCVWAYAYERSGSLLPSFASHAFNNSWIAAASLALMR
jgi:membrane protease YdiL (CAAX protease family)